MLFSTPLIQYEVNFECLGLGHAGSNMNHIEDFHSLFYLLMVNMGSEYLLAYVWNLGVWNFYAVYILKCIRV